MEINRNAVNTVRFDYKNGSKRIKSETVRDRIFGKMEATFRTVGMNR